LIKVIDPQSTEGLVKNLRRRVQRCRIWVANSRTRVVGWERQALETALQRP